MAGTYGFNPPVKKVPGAQQTNTSKRKNRIYQIFKSTIELDELSLPAKKSDKTQKIESLASLQYPLIKINDYFINDSEINLLTIDCKEFYPKITLQCTFLHQTFISKEMPKDGDIISIAIRNKSDVLKSVRNDYVITNVIYEKNPTTTQGPTTITFYGYLYVPWLSSAKFNYSFEGTSFEAIKDIATKTGLGFATNEDNTDDKQVWLSGYATTKQYILKTIERSWSDENSFYDVWIDIYYNLNFVNLNKQLISGESEIDIASWINSIDKDYTWGENEKQSDSTNTPKVLSNYMDYKTTPFYINSWKPINKSTAITFQVGTKMNCQMFEHNYNLYENKEQTYWRVAMEPTYDKDKINKYILLRGRATQDASLRGTDLAQVNYPFAEMYEKNPWLGVQYTISNPEKDNLKWDGNQHRNYLRSKVQNLINKKELDKLNVEVTVNGLNLNIIKGDKTPVVLIKKDPAENKIMHPTSDVWDALDQFYSGWYLVKGFSIKYDKVNAESVMSNFSQTFVLTRREWPPPIAVNAIENNKNNT